MILGRAPLMLPQTTEDSRRVRAWHERVFANKQGGEMSMPIAFGCSADIQLQWQPNVTLISSRTRPASQLCG